MHEKGPQVGMLYTVDVPMASHQELFLPTWN